MAKPRIALVHHWLTSPGGGEQVLYKLHQMYPDAPIYTSAFLPEKFPELAGADVRTSFVNRLPFIRRKHQLFPIFLGSIFKSFDLSDYDIVISSDAAEAKYVRTGDQTLHICYCHTPVRYYWSDYDWRLNNLPFGVLNPLARVVYPLLVGHLKKLDYAAAQKVDVFIANSRFIQARIKKYYNRESTVIYPPVITGPLEQLSGEKGDYYLIVGRQVAAKRLDVAVEAFNELGLPLKVVGVGEELDRQRPRAKGNIEFLGRLGDEERNQLLAGAKGFIFPPEEDFGMTPIEAMAAGTPVIAYGAGGALEYVEEGITGVLFSEQSGASLVEAVRRFEGLKFDDKTLRERARKFDESIFEREMRAFVDAQWGQFENKR